MGIIKLDLKTFWKSTLLYIIITQLLMFTATGVSNLSITSSSLIVEYFITFVIAMCIISVVVYTGLFAIYYNTKANAVHAESYQVADGYGLYRFLTTLKMLFVLTANILIGLQLNGFEIVDALLNLKYYELAGSIFVLLPLFVLVIISIAHVHGRRVVRNVEAMISLAVIFGGIYIAGNLYYFSNQQQGVAMLFILFVPLAILFMSIKERSSENSIYKVVIFIFCLLVTLISVGLLITSDFKYDTNRSDNYGEQYAPEYEVTTTDYSSEVIESDYGQIIKITDTSDGEYSLEQYQLTSANYTYRADVYGPTDYQFTAYQLNGPDVINISNGDYLTEAEVVVNSFDPTTSEHLNCVSAISDINADGCELDPEVLDVYSELASLIEDSRARK